ncbi:iron complex outermembrane recepter protein [Duganella sp. CF402]|uniref:TonB-dependent receptor domain-containing protein n=1 Tax=unclassified Duganella TaxID=2636909 RepID=UPI0008D0F7DE|nr:MULTISPECIES: TonB-dependent receptor [unclassified Duganella]RZT04248.1 iron complex outermembrane receptor protein [Duganella sp. BK701]SEM42788.1 iron complex outermembrane recepter protein [Duganella sp. CF402]
MMQTRVWSRSLGLVFSVALPAWAQDAPADQPMQRVEITGSSIKRIQQEGALPVQVLTAAQIKQTGAASATDLIQMLPSMQGFVPSSSSVNGGGGGVTTASLHSLPSKYTLVLLDGQRMAPSAIGNGQGGGFAVNLSSIPLEAVERVEILSDGASALYGSDAIAGVVNFILKKNKNDGEAYATYGQPRKNGGAWSSAGITKGWGDIDSQGWNVLASYSHEELERITALQRDFSARGAFFRFNSGGRQYYFDQRTGNTEPANITFNARPIGSSGDTAGYAINPYLAANGNCGSALAGPLATQCRFNYAATVEDVPGSRRDSGLLKASIKLNDSTTAWAELVLSQYAMTAQFAPSAQPMGVNASTRFPGLYARYVQPYLAANGLENPSGNATLGYRSVLIGGRADQYQTTARHFAAGIDGAAYGWTYNASLILSQARLKDTAAGGYSDFNLLNELVASDQYDPVIGRGADQLKGALLNGTVFSRTRSTLNTLHAGAQHDLFALPGGAAIISAGGDYSKTRYVIDYNPLILANSGFSTQPASANYPVGGSYGQVPFGARRDSWGVFTEMLFPVAKTLEATLSGRYDSYDKVHSDYIFASVPDASGLVPQLPSGDIGNTASAGTYKLSVKWTPADSLLLRASYASGFKAPNISDIAGANTFNGSTAGSYACPFPGSTGCLVGQAQYDLLIGPNSLGGAEGLQPEKSKQWTLGGRIEPRRGLSLGLDVWNVRIRNQVLSAGVPEQVGFASPQQYQHLFVNPYPDPAGYTTIAYLLAPINGGEANYRGIDWDFSYRGKSRVGDWRAGWDGTYMLTQNYTTTAGGAVQSNLGRFGPDNGVVFRVQSNLSLSLTTGKLTNTLTAHYKSGYHDQAYPVDTAVFAVNPDGSVGESVAFAGLWTPSYTTVDWQGKYEFGRFTLTAGIKNLFDRDPPFTLQNAGGGNQIGYDGRYADPAGRAFYLSGNVRF